MPCLGEFYSRDLILEISSLRDINIFRPFYRPLHQVNI